MISLCKKLNIINYIITCNPEPQGNGEIRGGFLSANWFFETVCFNELVQFASVLA